MCTPSLGLCFWDSVAGPVGPVICVTLQFLIVLRSLIAVADSSSLPCVFIHVSVFELKYPGSQYLLGPF